MSVINALPSTSIRPPSDEKRINIMIWWTNLQSTNPPCGIYNDGENLFFHPPEIPPGRLGMPLLTSNLRLFDQNSTIETFGAISVVHCGFNENPNEEYRHLGKNASIVLFSPVWKHLIPIRLTIHGQEMFFVGLKKWGTKFSFTHVKMPKI